MEQGIGVRKIQVPPRLWEIFSSFLGLGFTAFGGPAMVAYIKELAVNKKGWVSEESFQDGVALVQTVPGATAMQAAAYAGLRSAGLKGALSAYAGFSLPAFLLMLTLSIVYRRGQEIPAVVSAFSGLQVIVVAMVANAALNFGKKILRRPGDWSLCIPSAAFMAMGGSPIVAICLAGLAGAMIFRASGAGGIPPRGERGWTRRADLSRIWIPILLVSAVLATLYLLNKKAFELAALMMKVDLFAFGGAYASLPLMFHEVVEARSWMDSKTLMDGIALGQVTPGPIVITATFVGYYVMGIPGAVVGTVSILTPSFLILMAAVPYFDRLKALSVFRAAMRGILVSFVGLLVAVAFRFGTDVHWGAASTLIGLCALAALRCGVEILWVVLVGGLVAAVVL